MRTIKCLFLDIGGVLLSNGWGREFRQRAVKNFQLDVVDFEMRHKMFFTLAEEGKITLDEYLDRVVFYQERSFTKGEFRDFMFSLSIPNLEMITLFKNLKQEYGLSVVAVSNEARELNAYRINTFGLNEIIDFFVSSCYVHLRKPDAAIFRLALDGAQVAANEIVFIDDVAMFVEVAKDMGLVGIHHTDYVTTRKALSALGLSLDENNIL